MAMHRPAGAGWWFAVRCARLQSMQRSSRTRGRRWQGLPNTPTLPERPRRAVLVALLACALLVLACVPSEAAAPATAGQVYAFGDNYSGELGNTTGNIAEEAHPTPTPVDLPGATGPVTQLAAGTASLAVTSTGQLYAFGDNQYGQLGNTTDNGEEHKANPTPTLVTLPAAAGPVTRVAAGEFHSLAVTFSGQLYAFGNNYYGQLGNKTNEGSNTANPTPTPVTLPGATGPVTQVAAGEDDSFAVTATGQLYAFGENYYGELGNSATNGEYKANATPTLVTLPGATGPVTQVAAGTFHTLAMTSTGQLYAFGENYYGQLGSTTDNGAFDANPTPTPVTLPGATGPVTQIAAGGEHSLATTSTGQLYAFGENYYGQLGVAADSGTSNPTSTPTLVALPGASGPVTQIAAGAFYSLAVTTAGQLFGFGENYYGQLGSTTNNEQELPNPTPTQVALPAGTTIDTVARGAEAFQTLALVSDLAVSSTSLSYGEAGTPYSSTVQALGGTAPYTWSAAGLPAGLSINPTSGLINGSPAAVSDGSVTLTVTDAYGIAASASLPLAVGAVPCACDLLVHRLTIASASLTNRRFRVGKQATAISARKLPRGTVFRFTLSAPAKLRIAITRSAHGLRRGRSCVAPSAKLRRANARHCTRTLTVGTLTRTHQSSGAGHISFSGRIGRRALSPHSYRAVLTASNEEAGLSLPVTLSFTVVR